MKNSVVMSDIYCQIMVLEKQNFSLLYSETRLCDQYIYIYIYIYMYICVCVCVCVCVQDLE